MNDKEIAEQERNNEREQNNGMKQLEPIPDIKMLVILIGFAAGFAAVMYIAYLILMAV